MQRKHYSGKKKRHTLKTEYLITGRGRIVSLSASYPGRHHDLRIRREGPRLPGRARLYGDSAYQRYDREHPNIDFPYKRPKNGALSPNDKIYKAALARFRVAVEHRIGRAKRFRIVAERYRNPRRTHHTKTSIVAGMVHMNAGFAACETSGNRGTQAATARNQSRRTFATGLLRIWYMVRIEP